MADPKHSPEIRRAVGKVRRAHRTGDPARIAAARAELQRAVAVRRRREAEELERAAKLSQREAAELERAARLARLQEEASELGVEVVMS